MISIRSFIQKNHRALFYGGWLLVNLIQAGMTQLFDDEAYYWVYSHYLAWGYFDHPPMVALLIRAGYFFFKSELGVRVFIVLMSTATLFVIEKLLPKKNDLLFYGIACSMAVLQIGGIMAVPDIPLLFFGALFFLQYRRFLEKMTTGNAFLLGLVMALLLYSKYHAVLIFIFTFLSYPKLATRYQAWLALVVALVLFTPHLYWEYRHLFPSIQFHLVDRNADHYDLVYTLKYFPEQVLFVGPIAGFVLLWGAFAYRPKDLYERALRFTMIGIYFFFLVSSIKGRVEVNWTIPVVIPVMVLSHQYLLEHYQAARWVLRLAPVTLILVLAVRIFMMVEEPPFSGVAKDEVHGNRAWALAIKEKAGNFPVVFTDSYQYASKYWFYSGQPSFSLNTPYYRRNNFNFWPTENAIMGKTVYVVGDRTRFFLKDSISAGKGPEGGLLTGPYMSFSGIEIRSDNPITGEENQLLQTKLIVLVNKSLGNFLDQAPYHKLPVQLWVLNNDSLEKVINTGLTVDQLSPGENHLAISFPADLPPGDYNTRFAIPSAIPHIATVNSSFVRLKIRSSQ
jgi:hypothetical protein